MQTTVPEAGSWPPIPRPTRYSATIFDFGEWKSEVASRTNPDGTVSFITIVPGMIGLEFIVGSGEERTLIMRDAQHEYVFAES
jgi:hypothetical protein